jgi:hypothetical protein
VSKDVITFKLGSLKILPLDPVEVFIITTHLSPVTMGPETISPIISEVATILPLWVLIHLNLRLSAITEYTGFVLVSISLFRV